MRKNCKRVLSLILILAMVVGMMITTAFAANEAGDGFTDVSADDWYYDAVQYMAHQNIMNGTSTTGKTFSPGKVLDRGTIVTMLHRLEGEPQADSASFPDVEAGQWYAAAVNWAAANKVVQGYTSGKFGPTNGLTNEQLATILCRYAQMKGWAEASDKIATTEEALKWAEAQDLLAGEGGSKLDAGAYTTRAEAAVVLTAFCQKVMLPAKVAGIDYTNINYDFAEDIKAERAAVKLVPDAAGVDITVEDENGASGVVLTASHDEKNTEDLYLNAMVAGNKLTFSSTGDNKIASAESSASGKLTVSGGSFTVTPAALKAMEPADEIITVTMGDKTTYKIHTVNELMPTLTITGSKVAEANSGVYVFAVDKFLLRVDTKGNLVYYRNMGCVGELMAENFAPQTVGDKVYHSVFVELRQEFRNVMGGYSSGMYLVMDENFKDIDEVTLLPNDEENHTHGQGYLDQHEFVILGEDHYLLLSYTPEKVNNLPAGVKGLDGGSSGFVWAGVFQEVKDGKVLKEINTTDYPLLYESSVEKLDYANSTDQGVMANNGQQDVFSLADGWQDYVHPNSLDYTLNADGTVDKLLVSMRDQSAVYQFDFATGRIEWILGGKASTLTGFEEYTTVRDAEDGKKFNALTFGQHYARYTNKDENGVIDGEIEFTVFDNQTGDGPFLAHPPAPQMVPTLTRTFRVTVDPEAKTAQISDVINGVDLNEKTDKYHIASHCGSVDYFDPTSVVIGWGLHGVIDNIGKFAPQGTMSDIGFEDLRMGSRPIFSEYDMDQGEITFELSAQRNPLFEGHEALFSYRTYKDVSR